MPVKSRRYEVTRQFALILNSKVVVMSLINYFALGSINEVVSLYVSRVTEERFRRQ